MNTFFWRSIYHPHCNVTNVFPESQVFQDRAYVFFNSISSLLITMHGACKINDCSTNVLVDGKHKKKGKHSGTGVTVTLAPLISSLLSFPLV